MKSAYELALERMEKAGIAAPREDAFSPEVRAQMAEIRRQTEAKLAELEILHKDKMKTLGDPVKRAEQEDYVKRERQRLKDEGERKIETLRSGPK